MSQQPELVNLTIDGMAVQVPKGTTVYQAAKNLNIDIPVFCYQDRMAPFGACRVCLVEVEKMGKLQASCTLEAAEGMVVKTQSAPAVEGREGILELLLTSHPLDCPICDRGGECPLQEHALHYGPGKSRFFEEKRHFKKQLPLGPVLMLDRERCIVCARCTRFGEIIAGDQALQFIDRGYKTEVGTANGGTPESKFIGNTIKICPVGALTSQVYRFRARPWDNDSTPSTCTLCPVGCSLILDSRDGEVMRTRSDENRAVNDIWLCDKGWFGYEFTSSPERLQTPLIRKEGKLQESSWDEALSLIAARLQKAKGSGKIAAWGGNPLTIEENYFFQALMRKGAGTPHLDHRIGSPLFTLEEEGMPPGMEMEIGDTEALPFAILFGLDLTEEFPVIWLRLKQALNKGAHVIFAGHFAPEIAPHLTAVHLHAPGEELEQIKKTASTYAQETGKKGALFVGGQYLNHPHRAEILSALKNAFPAFSLNLLEGSNNSLGARLAGMRPDLAPLNKPASPAGLDAVAVLRSAEEEHWDVLYVAGANPAAKFPSANWGRARANLGFLVVQDLFLTETALQADVILPTLSYIEKGGHFINIEGRVQTLLPGKEIPENLYSDGEIFSKLAEKLSLTLALEKEFEAALQQPFMKITRQGSLATQAPSSKDKKPGLKLTVAKALFDNGVRMNHNPHVSQLVKPPKVGIHPSEGEKLQLKEGDPVSVSLNGNSIRGHVTLNSAISEGTVVLPLGFTALKTVDLSLNLMNGQTLELKREGS